MTELPYTASDNVRPAPKFTFHPPPLLHRSSYHLCTALCNNVHDKNWNCYAHAVHTADPGFNKTSLGRELEAASLAEGVQTLLTCLPPLNWPGAGVISSKTKHNKFSQLIIQAKFIVCTAYILVYYCMTEANHENSIGMRSAKLKYINH